MEYWNYVQPQTKLNSGILENWNIGWKAFNPTSHLFFVILTFSRYFISFHVIPLFHHFSIPSSCSIIRVGKSPAIGHPFAFVEAI